MTLGIATILENAAALIEEHGHARDTMRGDDGSVCVMGGICAAVQGYERQIVSAYHMGLVPDVERVLILDAAEALRGHLGLTLSEAYPLGFQMWAAWNLCAQWNNVTARDGAEVCRTLRECAALLRAGEPVLA